MPWMFGRKSHEKNGRFGDVMKTKCDKCKRYCNSIDKSRGMPARILKGKMQNKW